MIAIGGTNIVKAYLGSTELANIAIGDELLLSSGLPYDAVIEYLEGDNVNKPYINLGVTPNQSSYLKVVFSNAAPGNNIAGTRISGTNSQFLISTTTANTWQFCFGKNTYKFGTIDALQHTAIFDGNEVYLDGTLVYTFNAQTFNPNKSLFIFGLNNNGTASVAVQSLRIHQVTCSLVNREFDLVPVRKGSVGYMYDKLSGQLFGNAGTGNFVLGNDIT